MPAPRLSVVYISAMNGAGTSVASEATSTRPAGLRFFIQSDTTPAMTMPRKPPAAPQPPISSATISVLPYQGSGTPLAAIGTTKVRMA